MHTTRWGRILALCASTFTSAAWGAAASNVDPLADPPTPAFAGQTQAPAPAQPSRFDVEVLVSGLETPRSLVALPSGEFLVVEGAGRVRVLRPSGEFSEPLTGLPPMLSVGGRSLHDLVLDANFTQTRRVYFTYLAPGLGQQPGAYTADQRNAALERGEEFQTEKLASAVLREDLSGFDQVTTLRDFWGRRLLSAPDGSLYVSMMAFDYTFTERRDLAQQGESLRGKVLRLKSDGTSADGNPFVGMPDMAPELFTIGHRDPDGLALHPQTGELWGIEHGPMGGDEVNLLRAGYNYGWPNVTYGKNYDGTVIGPSAADGVEQPRYYWYPSIAISGLWFYTGDLFPEWQGNLFLGAMSPTQGKFLVRLVLEGDKVVNEERLLVERDRRVRAVTQGVDGALYVLTDSENNAASGRQFPGEVLRLTPR